MAFSFQLPTRTATIDAILKAFLALPAGSILSYADLSKAAGEKVTSTFYPLRRAIEIARDKHNVLIRNERGVGFARLGAFEDRRDALDSRRGKVRRQSLVGLKEIAASVRGSNANQREMMELTRYQGAFAVSHMATGGAPAAAKRISGEAFAEPKATADGLPK